MLTRKQTTVPVSTRALMQRINRRLKVVGETLKAARSERVASSVGQFFIVRRNKIAIQHVDPEALARKLGTLSAWEHVDYTGRTGE
jgi:hypothetical protein